MLMTEHNGNKWNVVGFILATTSDWTVACKQDQVVLHNINGFQFDLDFPKRLLRLRPVFRLIFNSFIKKFLPEETEREKRNELIFK